MKMTLLKPIQLLTFLSFLAMGFKAVAMPVDMHGYLRTGNGNNLQGGKQSCFNNPGAEGNEFRLGNECGIYGESSFALDFLQNNPANSSFKVQTTLAFFPSANTQYGDESDKNDVDIVEAFAEAKNLEGAPFTYWVGKRFYRDVDIHMNDFYYFAAMNGVGAGVKDIPLLNAKFAVAYLQETMTSTSNSDQLNKSFLDFRLFELKTNWGEFNFWGTLAHAPEGHIGTTRYQKVDGELFGVRLRNNLANGFNDFALVYGRNLMSAMSVYGNGEIKSGVNNNQRYKLRVVEHVTTKIHDKMELHAASVFEQRFNGGNSSTWWDIGMRPVYFINNNLHFVTEVGHSEVASRFETLTLSRLTFAYELTLNQSIWARPVLRAFASETIWNQANRKNFNNKKDGHSVGFQAEAWF